MELDDVRCLAVLGLRRSGRPAALLGRRRLPAARVVALDAVSYTHLTLPTNREV